MKTVTVVLMLLFGLAFSSKSAPGMADTLKKLILRFFELARVLVRFDHVARFIVNANHSAM